MSFIKEKYFLQQFQSLLITKTSDFFFKSVLRSFLRLPLRTSNKQR